MDVLPSKRATSVVGLSRRRSSFSFRVPKNDNGGTQSCNRLGCSIRYGAGKDSEVRSSENKTSSKPPRSRSKSLNASTSKLSSSSSNLRKPKEERNLASVHKTISASCSRGHKHMYASDSSSRFVDEEKLEAVHSVTENRINSRENIENQRLDQYSAADVSEPPENSVQCGATVKTKSCKKTNQQIVSSKYGDVSLSSHVQHSITSQNSTRTKRPSHSQGCSHKSQKNCPRNLTCTSKSDFLSGCSSMNSTTNGQMKKRSPNGGSSASRRKGIAGSSTRGSSDSPGANAVANPSITKDILPEAVTSRTRNQAVGRDISSSIRTQRRTNGQNWRLSETRLPAQLPQAQNSLCEGTITRRLQSSRREATITGSSSTNILGRRQVCYRDNRSTQMHHASIVDGYNSEYVMDGIAQVLYALEAIDQEDLAREQLLGLESSLILGAVGYHDQLRDMRLDIDDMSYEELLALGEQMGTVSTALSEEALSKCLKRNIYDPASLVSGSSVFLNDDIKCSICQEEYAEGDEVGKLWCGHLYHVNCVHQWLRRKNWCPICRASALPS